MAIHAQSQHAFLPGCDLWVVSQKIPRSFFLKLDWYLNFQISKGLRRQTRPRAEVLDSWVKDTGLDFVEQKNPAMAALVITPPTLLPCRWLFYSECSDLNSWVEGLNPHWTGLGKPSLKFFLPEGEDVKALMAAWKPFDPIDEYTIVNFSPLSA